MRLKVDPPEHRITFGDTAEFELSGLTATTACQLLVRPCLRVTKGPKLEKSADGAITLDFSLANCSGLDLGITINLKRHDTAHGDSWDLELEAGAGPFSFFHQLTEQGDHLTRSDQLDFAIVAEGAEILDHPIELRLDRTKARSGPVPVCRGWSPARSAPYWPLG